ncbi:MAG: signal peptidase II [Eubacteriales bacterium]|nr:signal peptidase II [Eubacteriales bacterium]
MLAFFIIFGAVVLDQFTKFLVRLYMNVGESFTLIPGIMNITYVENDGAAFGMLDNARWVFLIISCVAITGIVWFLRKHGSRHPLLTVPLSFIAGGGIGNMIDRIFVTDANGTNVVTDFFETKFVKFAVFNIADSFITVGAILLGFYIIFIEPKVEKRLKSAAAAANAAAANAAAEADTDDAEADEYDRKDNGENENNCTENR